MHDLGCSEYIEISLTERESADNGTENGRKWTVDLVDERKGRDIEEHERQSE